MKKEKKWYEDGYDLYENDTDKTLQVFNVKIRMDTPDGITTSRLMRVIGCALSDSAYLNNEVTRHTVSAELLKEDQLSIEDLDNINTDLEIDAKFLH